MPTIRQQILDTIETRVKAMTAHFDAVSLTILGGDSAGNPDQKASIDIVVADPEALDDFHERSPTGYLEFTFPVAFTVRFGKPYMGARSAIAAAEDLGRELYLAVCRAADQGTVGGLAVRTAWFGGGSVNIDNGIVLCGWVMNIHYRHREDDPSVI